MRSLLFIMAIILGIQSEAWSQQLDYPELNVTPRASTRVNMEGKWEGENTLGNAWPLAVAGLGTLLATSSISDVIDDEKDPEGYSQTIGYTAGLLTLGASAYLALKFRPFDDMRNKLSKVGGKTTRGQLTRERIAEEELKRLSKLGYYSRITFSIMNLLANNYMKQNLTDDESKEDERAKADLMINIANLTSLIPLFFSTRWEHVYDEQMTYKKRIYAPVSYTPIFNEPFSNKVAGGFGLIYRY